MKKKIDIEYEYRLGMGDSVCEPYPDLDKQGEECAVASDSDATQACSRCQEDCFECGCACHPF